MLERLTHIKLKIFKLLQKSEEKESVSKTMFGPANILQAEHRSV